MPTANVRYGRPKGSGLDDRQQLQSLAALLAANPQLKTTTAIRSLGVEDPSTIRRLRDKFRVEQAKLMADARGAPRVNGAHGLRPSSNETTPVPQAERAHARLLSTPVRMTEPGPATPTSVLAAGWCDVGFAFLSAAAESQVALTQYWLGQPAVVMALRG